MTAIACAALGSSLAPIYPMLISITPTRVGATYAQQAIGFQVSAAYLGAAALPTIGGVLARRFGLESICPYVVGCLLVLLVMHEVIVAMARGYACKLREAR
jgi:fucose permease